MNVDGSVSVVDTITRPDVRNDTANGLGIESHHSHHSWVPVDVSLRPLVPHKPERKDAMVGSHHSTNVDVVGPDRPRPDPRIYHDFDVVICAGCQDSCYEWSMWIDDWCGYFRQHDYERVSVVGINQCRCAHRPHELG